MHRGLCLSEGDARLKTGNHQQPFGRARDPDIRGTVHVEPVEPWRGDADDRVALAIDRQRAPDDIPAFSEPVTPPARADDGDAAVRRMGRSADDR